MGLYRLLLFALISIVLLFVALFFILDFFSYDGPGRLRLDPIESTSYPPMVADSYEPCDNDRDGDCDKADYELVTQAIGNCEYGKGYNELADADHDGCVTESDRDMLFPIIPEKKYKETPNPFSDQRFSN